MTYDRQRDRRSIRLKGYDYAEAGAYFVTIVSRNRVCMFGDISGGEMRLNDTGRIVEQCWGEIPEHFSNVDLDAFVVMPNHLHGIIVITPPVGATHESPMPDARLPPAGATHASPLPGGVWHGGPRRQSLGVIVGSFKSAVTRRLNLMHGASGPTMWQRNYFEHIIRSDESLSSIRQYVFDNPGRWEADRENPAATGPVQEGTFPCDT